MYYDNFFFISSVQLLIYTIVNYFCEILEYIVEHEPSDIKAGNLNYYLNEKYGYMVMKNMRREIFELTSLLFGIFFFYFFIFGVCLTYKEFYKTNIPYGIY